MASAAVPEAPPIPGLDECIERAIAYFRAAQYPEGYWWAELESNVTMASEHMMLERILGIAEEARTRKIARYLLDRQNDDGSWSIYYGGPGDLSVTVEAYFALKLAGHDAASPEMTRAREFVLSKGGAGRSRVFTKLWLAMFGEFDWDALPAMPPEAILLPPWFPFNIYEFASWARGTIVPILVVWAYRPVTAIRPEESPAELFAAPEDRRR
ncbi:MAG: squalene--hopene cyclase, partial [Dehalococcoidia bacterium]|nr:squalene--hopene cyclase [Dehalococcoidia bacterium]